MRLDQLRNGAWSESIGVFYDVLQKGLHLSSLRSYDTILQSNAQGRLQE